MLIVLHSPSAAKAATPAEPIVVSLCSTRPASNFPPFYLLQGDLTVHDSMAMLRPRSLPHLNPLDSTDEQAHTTFCSSDALVLSPVMSLRTGMDCYPQVSHRKTLRPLLPPLLSSSLLSSPLLSSPLLSVSYNAHPPPSPPLTRAPFLLQ